MATRVKTIEFWFPAGTTLVDNTDTNLTQITLYRPETVGASPFKSVFSECTVHDRNTTLGNINRFQSSLQLGAAGYSVVNNANAIANGGKQQNILFTADFTSYFNTNWSGTSMTCDFRLLLDSAVASPLNPSFNNVSVRLVITYEYDDTSTTQIKTIRIPLDCPVGVMGTTKPGAANATIPNLDTELPESSKTYRQTVLVLQGNDQNTGTTDQTFTMQIDSNTAYTTDTYEHGSTVSMFCRNNSIQSFTTNATHGFYVWSSLAFGNHMQAWLVVTYEFSASSSTDCFVSLMLVPEAPMKLGGTTSSDYQRASISFFIEEPTTITTKQAAFYAFWDSASNISGLNFRIGTGAFVTYTDSATVYSGSNAAMVRNDSAFSLARGLNTINFDAYTSSDAVDKAAGLSGFFIINYTCAKPTNGYGSANRTIEYMFGASGTSAAVVETVFTATGIPLTVTDYYVNNIGFSVQYINTGTTAPAGVYACVERLSGESGVVWEPVFSSFSDLDGETGIFKYYGSNKKLFKRTLNDADSNRVDIETSRRYAVTVGKAVSVIPSINALMTLHEITFTVGGTVSGSSGGTVNLFLDDYTSGERMLSTTRSGNGSYSFTWYDNTRDMIVSAWESNTVIGLSGKGTATGSP